jgi:hypothetical protein
MYQTHCVIGEDCEVGRNPRGSGKGSFFYHQNKLSDTEEQICFLLSVMALFQTTVPAYFNLHITVHCLP